MHKTRTLFLSRDIKKWSFGAAMREVAASRATVPISWYSVIRTVFWFYAYPSGCFLAKVVHFYMQYTDFAGMEPMRSKEDMAYW